MYFRSGADNEHWETELFHVMLETACLMTTRRRAVSILLPVEARHSSSKPSRGLYWGPVHGAVAHC